jgi:hypothetical protein
VEVEPGQAEQLEPLLASRVARQEQSQQALAVHRRLLVRAGLEG